MDCDCQDNNLCCPFVEINRQTLHSCTILCDGKNRIYKFYDEGSYFYYFAPSKEWAIKDYQISNEGALARDIKVRPVVLKENAELPYKGRKYMISELIYKNKLKEPQLVCEVLLHE